MQVAKIDIVAIDNPNFPHARGCQIKRRRRAEPARADAQYASRFEPALSFRPHLRHQQVPRIPHTLFLSELDRVAHDRRAI